MSVLEVFVRARQYRDRAAEFFELAAHPFSEEVRARYLAVADHYTALAEAEIRADKLLRQKRLEQMRAEREKARRAGPAPEADHPPAPRAEPAKLQPIQATKRPTRHGSSSPAQMAAQSVFTTAGTAR